MEIIVYMILRVSTLPDRFKRKNEEFRMKTDLKHRFRWLESTPWTETPLYPGRAQKPEEQAKYDAGMATKTGISKTIYALLRLFWWSKQNT
jgi:hypothetical protein